MNDDRGLVDLAASVADGEAIDWAALEAELSSDAERSLFRQLRVLADIAELHRSVPDEPPASPRLSASESDDAAISAFPSLATTLAAPDGSPPADPPPLGRWGPYELRASLGGGILGEVIRATDHLQREVTIRFLPPDAPGAHVDALLRTGQLLASVRHPNVVQVYGTEEHEGRVGLVMESIAGRDLREVVLTQGTLSAREAALIGWELCRAVAALHREGLVHGLLSPGNIVRESGGRLVLLDVWPQGLPVSSLSLDPLDLPFVPPEVAGGGPPSVRGDVYSLGVTLYALVAGRTPITATTPEDIGVALQRGSRVPLADLRPDLADDFIRIVERATEADPDRRFPSVSALKEALSRTLGWDTWARRRSSTGTGAPVLETTAGVVSPHPDTSWSLGLVAVATAAIAVGGVAAWLLLAQLASGPADGPRQMPGAAVVEGRSGDIRLALGGAAGADADLTPFVVEQLAQDLSTSPRFRVIAPVAVEHLVGRPVPAIMQAVDADVYLDVAAQRTEGGVTATIRIVRRSGEPVEVREAGGAGQGSLRPFTSALAQRVVTSLTSADEPLQPSLRTQLPLENPAAMRAYIEGQTGLSRGGRQDVEAAADAFRRATEAEPDFVLAYAKWAEALLSLYRHNALAADEALPLAQDVIAQALSRDDRSAEAYAALADLYAERHIWSQAERHFQRSLALNPSGEYARIRYAMLLSGRGRVDEAVEQSRQASALNPRSSVLSGYAGATLHYAHRFEEAARLYERVLRLDAQYSAAYIGLCKAYTELRRTEQALEACRMVETQQAAEDPFVQSQYVKIQADAGNRSQALRHLANLQRIYEARPTGDGAFWVALAYISLGDYDQALAWLDTAIAGQSSRLAYARVDSRLDPLRGDPRFVSRMARIEEVTSAPVAEPSATPPS